MRHLSHGPQISLLAGAKRPLHTSRIYVQCIWMLDTADAPLKIRKKAFPLQRPLTNLFFLEGLFEGTRALIVPHTV